MLLPQRSLCWHPHTLFRHASAPQRKAAEQLGMSDEELDERLHRLLLLLPDMRQKLASMRPQLVAALAAQVDQLPGVQTGGSMGWLPVLQLLN